MPSISVAFHTLGCKLNQLETESIAQAFREEGFSVLPWGQSADIYIINTCTVTSMAEQKARREIRRLLRDRPFSSIIATGCYAQLDAVALQELELNLQGMADSEDDAGPLPRIPERRRITVVSGDLKAILMDLPGYLADSACSTTEIPDLLQAWSRLGTSGTADRFRFDANEFAYHSRASLKIQDGCDNVCAYCRVRLARGSSLSLDAERALSRLRELEEKGYSEAVLTGINLSRYRDRERDLPALIGIFLGGTQKINLRISSTEPDGVDGDFAQAVSHSRVRPHFHLSVQSGSDRVLHAMRRRYGSGQVLDAAKLLRAAKDDPFLACDMIAGFPGETDADFERTYALCEEIGFAWIHAFPFSPRPGTEAAEMKPRVPERTASERVERLIALAHTGRDAYLERWRGREVDAVVEAGPVPGKPIGPESTETTGENRDFAALSGNYLKLIVHAREGLRLPKTATAIRCLIVAPTEHAFFDAGAELLEILS